MTLLHPVLQGANIKWETLSYSVSLKVGIQNGRC